MGGRKTRRRRNRSRKRQKKLPKLLMSKDGKRVAEYPFEIPDLARFDCCTNQMQKGKFTGFHNSDLPLSFSEFNTFLKTATKIWKDIEKKSSIIFSFLLFLFGAPALVLVVVMFHVLVVLVIGTFGIWLEEDPDSLELPFFDDINYY